MKLREKSEREVRERRQGSDDDEVAKERNERTYMHVDFASVCVCACVCVLACAALACHPPRDHNSRSRGEGKESESRLQSGRGKSELGSSSGTPRERDIRTAAVDG